MSNGSIIETVSKGIMHNLLELLLYCFVSIGLQESYQGLFAVY